MELAGYFSAGPIFDVAMGVNYLKEMLPRERLICALDITEPDQIERLIVRLDGLVDFYKVGMLLHLVEGTKFVRNMIDKGYRIFLDLKFYDVPDTVSKVVGFAAGLGIHFLTVHGNREILVRAADAAGGTNLKILAVTALTSLDETDIKSMGFPCSVQELVLQRARWALECGCAGVVASPQEASSIRSALGPEIVIVTPGIRPRGTARGSHKRAASPGSAVKAGADFLVVGQPIFNASDPRRTAQEIIDDIGD